jgi:retinol dehydrogenase 14
LIIQIGALKMSTKTALITGGTSGIGRETALRLAKQGYTVVIIGRNTQAGQTVVAQNGGKVDFIQADFSRLAEVRRVATEFRQKHNRLDVLVLSAGVMEFKRTYTAEGYEYNFGTNYLSNFLLVNLLLDTLKASAPSRIVVVSASGAYPKPGIDFDSLQGDHKLRGFTAIMQSSFAKDVFAAELTRRLEGTNVSVNTLSPGVVRTNIIRTAPFPFNVLFKLATPFVTPVEKAVETPLYLATAPELAGVSGKYFKNKKPIEVAPLTFDQKLGRKLWEVSEKMSGAVAVS